jgi:hypothetical protein
MEEKFYFRDTPKAIKIQREADELIGTANNVLSAYEKAGFKIKSLDEFQKLVINRPDERPVKEILNQSKTINLIEAFKL